MFLMQGVSSRVGLRVQLLLLFLKKTSLVYFTEVYHLVVICTSENEYKARIVAVLEKYRRPAPALSNKSTIQKFIHHCFSGLRKVHGMQSASALDPER